MEIPTRVDFDHTGVNFEHLLTKGYISWKPHSLCSIKNWSLVIIQNMTYTGGHYTSPPLAERMTCYPWPCMGF